MDSAVASGETILGESPAAERARIMFSLNSDAVLDLLEKHEKITRRKAAIERARSREPITPSKVENSNEKNLKRAEKRAAEL